MESKTYYKGAILYKIFLRCCMCGRDKTFAVTEHKSKAETHQVTAIHMIIERELDCLCGSQKFVVLKKKEEV